MTKTLIGLAASALLLASAAYASENKEHKEKKEHGEKKEAHWDYGKHGPACWGDFSTTCADGKAQSPINIETAKTVALQAQHTLNINGYKNVEANVVDNGHSIKVTPENAGSITLDGVEYKLLQFHFHGYSEHTVDGKQYDLVAHLVHQNKDGGLAVIGVLFNEGEENPVLADVLSNVGCDTVLDTAGLLPADTDKYYHYKGSLTTPPCSEGVQWYVMKKPATASAAQLESFRMYYKDNFRPTQPVNDRKIEAN